MKPNPSNVKRILSHLQEVLRIQDYDITVKFVNDGQMMKYTDGENYAGLCETDTAEETVDILVNVEAEENSGDGWYYTLIHEVLHVVMNSLESVKANASDNDDLWEINMEKTVNKLAKGLVNFI